MVKILIDTKGGDNGAKVMIGGAKAALEKFEELELVLVGDEALIKEECEKNAVPSSRVEIINAEGEITNYDNPAEALFKKTDLLFAVLISISAVFTTALSFAFPRVFIIGFAAPRITPPPREPIS